jgi:hypothetical protein
MTGGSLKMNRMMFRENMGVLGLIQVTNISDRIFSYLDSDHDDWVHNNFWNHEKKM